ncbi:MAG: hypothetical protein ACTSW2_08925 [Alphaproteobacteria bacterium]
MKTTDRRDNNALWKPFHRWRNLDTIAMILQIIWGLLASAAGGRDSRRELALGGKAT